ncbi:MAG: protein kinase [Thermoflexales bacterium]
MMLQERFGPYSLINRIGQGGQSTVFRALDPQGRTVCLKVLNKDLLGSADQRRRFLLEPRQQPLHPNIVRIIDPGGECPADRAGEFSDGHSVPYFATEFIEGRSLQQMMRDSYGNPVRISPRDLYPILRDIGAALDAVHQRGIIHRDIKPGNILLRAVDRRAYLADFGIAKSAVTGNMTMTTTNRPGSATYMAPEQADVRLGAMGPASDVYSMGVTAYEALTGRPPFVAQIDVAVMYKHINETPADIRLVAPDVPRPIAAAVMRALNKAPGERYPNAGAFANAYFEALTRSAQAVAAPPLARPGPATRRRSGWLVPAVVLAALLAFSAISLALAGGMRPPDSVPVTQTAGSQASPRVTQSAAVTSAPTPIAGGTTTPATATTSAQGVVATSTLDPYLPIATSTLVPDIISTSRPTQGPTAASSATPSATVAPITQAPRLDALGRGGYEEWGRPPSPTRCDDIRNDRGRGFRFKITVRLSNPGPAALEGLFARFLDVNGQAVTACIDGIGPSFVPKIPSGQARDMVVLAYLETKSIKKLAIDGPGGNDAELCYNGEEPVGCR